MNKNKMKILFAAVAFMAAILLAGCGKYMYHAYGATGKEYAAPDACKAVAACVAAGEKECLYAHSENFTCREKTDPAQPPLK